jgi:hypothetical protein
MPFLSYEARNFGTPLAGPASGLLSLSLARLVSATLEDEADVTGENEATCVWF